MGLTRTQQNVFKEIENLNSPGILRTNLNNLNDLQTSTVNVSTGTESRSESKTEITYTDVN